MSSEQEDIEKFIRGEEEYFALRSRHFHLDIDLDAHRPENAPENRITAHISCTDDNGLNGELTKKSLQKLKSALAIDIGGGITQNRVYADQGGGVSLVVELDAYPDLINRRQLYDRVKEGFDRANAIYEKHVAEKPDRQTHNISEALEKFDGQTVTPELREQMAAELVKQLLARKERQ